MSDSASFDLTGLDVVARLNDDGASIDLSGFTVVAGVPPGDDSASVDLSGFTTSGTIVNGGSMSASIDISNEFEVVAYQAPFTDIDIDFGVSGSVITGQMSSARLSLSGFTVTGVAPGFTVISGDLSIGFDVSGSVVSENVGRGNITINTVGVVAVGVPGRVASGSISIDFGVSGSGYSDIDYVGSIDIPSLGVSGLIVETLPDEDFKVIAVNPEVGGDSVTEFQSYDFNSFALFNGVYYGVGADGMFEIEGSDDDGVAIAARAVLGITDFESETQMRVPYAYLTYRTTGDLILVTRTNESVERKNAADWDQRTGIIEKRVKLNPGVKERQWQFGIENVDGADFELVAVRPLPMPTDRRIK